MGDKLLVDYSSKWIRSGKEDDGKYGWVAKILAEGIENARKNQEDLNERMQTMNAILRNTQAAEGNMEAMQSETRRALWTVKLRGGGSCLPIRHWFNRQPTA